MKISVLNKSFSYLLPLVLSYSKTRFKNYISNTFLFLEGLPTDDLILAVLLREGEDYNDFDSFRESLYESDLFSYEFTSDKGQVLIFDMSPFKLDYESFLEGSYSKFKTSSKDIILRFLKNDLKLSKDDVEDFEGILYLKEKYRIKLEEMLDVEIEKTVELSDKFKIENETYK